MTIEEYMGELTAQERLSFQRVCRKLLKHTFIVRDIDESEKKDYFFVCRNRELLEAYMELMGFDVMVDQTTGVVMLANASVYGNTGGVQSNRIQLKKQESILLCCLWLIYSQRMVIGTNSMALVIDKAELDYQLEQFGAAQLFDKSAMSRSLELFHRYRLVKVIGRIGDEDCKLQLYPSLQFCMEDERFSQFVEQTAERMMDSEEPVTEPLDEAFEEDEEMEAGDDDDEQW